jgi:2-hydroxy-3-keto-5-methylthiopentenyl-1-phosphate phosphatase
MPPAGSNTSPPPVAALVIDFDGTIVEQDVSEEILQAFAPPAWWDIDLEFQRGEIGSRECLTRQAALLSGRRDDMLTFAMSQYTLDPTFAPFVQWASEAGLAVTVASDGLGFYVAPMLAAAGVEGVQVMTNEVTLEPGAPPSFAFPNGHPVCRGCGTCKMLIVLFERERHGPVALIGEGHTDRYGALYADVVFAKKNLPAICRADGVAFREWETFDDVRSALEETDPPPGPVGPAQCPGWTEP